MPVAASKNALISFILLSIGEFLSCILDAKMLCIIFFICIHEMLFVFLDLIIKVKYTIYFLKIQAKLF